MTSNVLNNYAYSILVMFIAFAFFCLLIFIMMKKNDSKIFKRFFFVFRWWIIGKTHCDTDTEINMFYKLLHKVFWGFILISISLTFATILQIIGGIEWK